MESKHIEGAQIQFLDQQLIQEQVNKLVNEQFDVFIQSNSIKVNTLGGVVLFILLIMGIGLLIFCKRFDFIKNNYIYLQTIILGKNVGNVSEIITARFSAKTWNLS